jgi:hypothetical protein
MIAPFFVFLWLNVYTLTLQRESVFLILAGELQNPDKK